VIAPATRRRRKPRRPWLPWLVGLVLAAVLLGVGVAIGMALEDNPTPGLTVTTTQTTIP
jgi:hypothetical protein